MFKSFNATAFTIFFYIIEQGFVNLILSNKFLRIGYYIDKDIIVLIYENKVIGSWISPEYSNEMERDHVWISMSGQN